MYEFLLFLGQVRMIPRWVTERFRKVQGIDDFCMIDLGRYQCHIGNDYR